MINLKSLFTFILIVTLGITYGQMNKFDIGIEAGPSLIFLKGNDILDNFNEPTIGFIGGVSFQYNFKKIISLRTNVAFERKGSKAMIEFTDSNGNSNGTGTLHNNYNYLTLPILVRASFGKKLQFFVNAGPYFGYLFKQTFVTRGNNLNGIKVDNTSLNKRLDVGLATGLGLSIPIKQKISFTIEIRNNIGLNNVSKVEVFNNGTIKTSSTNLIIGFAYKLGKRSLDNY